MAFYLKQLPFREQSACNKYNMIKKNNEGIDPTVKEAMKNKIRAEIEKMKAAEDKGDSQAGDKIMILNQRIRLIDSYRPFDETRISSLEKVFKHYCVHTSINGKRNITFDRIIYENEHLTTQRFFAFINDFRLNQIPTQEGGSKLLTDRNKITLLFKKSSSNSRDLSFSEFIICLERVFVLLFTETENYDRKMQKLQAEKKKRLEKQKKREEKKRQKMRKKNKEKVPEKEEGKEEGKEEQQGESEYESESEEEKDDKKVKQSQDKAKQPEIKKSAEPKNTENDEMVKQMLKNFEIVNPTDEVKDAVKAVKKEKRNQDEEDQVQIQIDFDPYAISDEQKIESYMLRLGVDNFKLMQKKMRYFQKANIKHDEGDPMDKAMGLKKSKMQMFKKDELTHYENASIHEQWSSDKRAAQEKRTKRLMNIKDMIAGRDQEKSKIHLSESLPKGAYEQKKKKFDQSFVRRQKGQMPSFALARVTKMKEEEQEKSLNFSLEMINRSTPNQLPFNKINPERYLNYDPTDKIFMQEFGEYDVTFRGKMARDASLVESTKKRAREIQNQEAKRLNQITENRFKNPHYLQKFLQRKW